MTDNEPVWLADHPRLTVTKRTDPLKETGSFALDDLTTVLMPTEHPSPGLDQQVFVTNEQMVRWEAAFRAFAAAQAEMAALYEASSKLQDATEEILDEVEEAERDESYRIRVAADEIAEAEADREHGPREWFRVEQRRASVRRGSRLVSVTIHHIFCRTAPRQQFRRDEIMRMPDAVGYVLKGERPGVDLRVCKRCAGRLTEAVAAEAARTGQPLPHEVPQPPKLVRHGRGYRVEDRITGDVLGRVEHVLKPGYTAWGAWAADGTVLVDNEPSRADAVAEIVRRRRG